MSKKLKPPREPLRYERIPRPDIYIQGVPVFLLSRGAVRRTGRGAILRNIRAAKSLMNFIRSLYGPRRMHKLVQAKEGKSIITYFTTDLITILKKVKIREPAAQIIAGAAISVSREAGDGAVSTIILAGKILEKCEKLIRKGIHPSHLLDGLVNSAKFVLSKMNDLIVSNGFSKEAAVKYGIRSSLIGKVPLTDLNFFTDLVVRATEIVGYENLKNMGNMYPHRIVDVKIAEGGSLRDSHTVDGIVIFGKPPHPRMPREVNDAKIAVIRNVELITPKGQGIVKRYWNYRLVFNRTDFLHEFERSRKQYLFELADKILASGANVIIMEKGVDDLLLEYFADKGVLVIRGIPIQELERIAQSVGANMVADLNDLRPSDLGYASRIEVKKLGERHWIYIKGCKNPQTIDIVLRGFAHQITGEIERIIYNALRAARTAYLDQRFVYGGGAFEEEIALALERHAETFTDKNQVVMKAVAEAFEGIPEVLASNCGLNTLDAIIELRARHAKGEKDAGIDGVGRRIESMEKLGVYDSAKVKEYVIRAAFEVAYSILRVDEYIKLRPLPEPERYYKQRMKALSKEHVKKLREDYGLDYVKSAEESE